MMEFVSIMVIAFIAYFLGIGHGIRYRKIRDTSKSLRVLVHDIGDGWPVLYSDLGVDIIWVCDHIPEDRFYRMRRESIPKDLEQDLENADIGHAGDDDFNSAMALTAIAELKGESHLKPVE